MIADRLDRLLGAGVVKHIKRYPAALGNTAIPRRTGGHRAGG